MAQSSLADSDPWGGGVGDGANGNGNGNGAAAGRERGARRKKMMGYLKAANELRQAYSAQWAKSSSSWDYDDDGSRMPGAFPDVQIARSGDEEMVIFPSYARRHTRRRTSEVDAHPPGADDPDFWREDWETFVDRTAVVDVDVRGWIYSPHRGPMSRKQRLLVALARKLSGIPAPTGGSTNGQGSGQADRMSTSAKQQQEEEDVNNEVQSILNRAEGEADIPLRGDSSGDHDERAGPRNLSRTTTQATSSMTKDEWTVANANLMERLRPFLSNPLAGVPITVFFFDDTQSQSMNVMTNEAGHFSLRAPLRFVPTQFRVLASENLSATKEVEAIEPKGISLISDIDDTIKHSAITAGAKEIFRNTFVRELNDLTINGVREWYSKMASMGVKMHYVSNSPWQLYPLLETYFKLAGLPPGSFHLKQYSGMLQGIFEPTAERKRGSLERIMRDFPDRKFILVGDSGEADLEVYTDIALENPGRVLGIFIRDVTTPEQKRFFDKSVDHLEDVSSRRRSQSRSTDDSDAAHKRPPLPPRKPVERSSALVAKNLDTGDLIDLGDPEDESKDTSDATKPSNGPPVVRPFKPQALRTVPGETAGTSKGEKEASSTPSSTIPRKPAPPLPSKPRRLSTPIERPIPEQPPPLPARPSHLVQQSDSSTVGASRGANGSAEGQASVRTNQPERSQPEGYAATMMNVVENPYNNLPSAKGTLNAIPGASSGSTTAFESNGAQPPRSKQPPPPPPRRTNTAVSTPAVNSTPPPPAPPRKQPFPLGAASASSQYPSDYPKPSASTPTLGRTSTSSSTSDYDAVPSGVSTPVSEPPLPNKREELWRRRWQRAKYILDQKGVVLGTWRVGGDVQDVCVWLVEEARKEMCLDQETGVERRG
ncbi:hypothetical protein VTN02DRAFT_5125 [Thermoascus thermophilus]